MTCTTHHHACECREALFAEVVAALTECANDLEAELAEHYAGTLDYPGMLIDYRADMQPVVVARELLAKLGK